MKIILLLLLICTISQVQSRFVVLSRYSDLLQTVSRLPNKMIAVLIVSSEECQNCRPAQTVFLKYSIQNEGMINCFLIECEYLWRNPEDRERLPPCNPEYRSQLPSVQFLVPEINSKIPKTVFFQGKMTVEALEQKTKELLPYYIKDLMNLKYLDKFLNSTQTKEKVILFVEDADQICLQYKVLSADYRGEIEFASFDLKDQNVYKRFNVTKVPSLVYLPDKDSEPFVYDEQLFYHSIRNFITKSQTWDPDDEGEDETDEEEQNEYFKFQQTNSFNKRKLYVPVNAHANPTKKIGMGELPEILKKNPDTFIAVNIYKYNDMKGINEDFQQIRQDYGNQFKYYEIYCEDKRCDQQFTQSVFSPATLVFGFKKNYTDAIATNQQYKKEKLAQQMIEKHLKPQFKENIVNNDAQFQFQMQKALKEHLFVVYFFVDEKDYFARFINLYVTTLKRFYKHLHFITYFNPPQKTMEQWVTNKKGLPYVGAITDLLEKDASYRLQPFEYPSYDYSNLISYLNYICNIKINRYMSSNYLEEVKNYEQFEHLCENKNTLCVLGLFDGFKQGKYKQDIEALNAVKKKVLDADEENVYDFGFIDAGCHVEILKSLNLKEDQLNTFLFVDYENLKYIVYPQKFEYDSAHEFILNLKNQKLKSFRGVTIDIEERDCTKLKKPIILEEKDESPFAEQRQKQKQIQQEEKQKQKERRRLELKNKAAQKRILKKQDL